jgi:hypothetical protein
MRAVAPKIEESCRLREVELVLIKMVYVPVPLPVWGISGLLGINYG